MGEMMKQSADAFPDFLGIGAQKTGTTWLWANLRKHPQLWLPPRKEVHYFDRAPRYASPSYLAESRLSKRLFGRGKHNKRYRKVLVREIGRNVRYPSWDQLRWGMRYMLGTYNDQWYASLFEQGRGKVKGEITPAYSILDPQDVEHISKLMPEAKIIYTLRNPIERTWSRIRKRAGNSGWELNNMPREELERLASIPALVARSDYVQALTVWRSYFPEEQIFVGFYEDIVERPREFLLNVFEFLGVEAAEKHVSHVAAQRVNASPSAAMPQGLQRYLAEKYYEPIKQLDSMVGGAAGRWLQEVESTLQMANGRVATQSS
jgi:hypothetical protein